MKYAPAFLFFLCLYSIHSYSQEKDNLSIVRIGFGMALNFEVLDADLAEDVGLSKTGFTLIDFRGRLNLIRYITLDIGGYVSQFKDELPFTEAVMFTSGQLAGLPTDATSEIVSGGWYYSFGAKLPFSKRFFLNAQIGNRNFSASRTIPACTNCMKTEINVEAGAYIRGGVSLMNLDEKTTGEFDLLYTHYLGESIFENTFTIGFFVYF